MQFSFVTLFAVALGILAAVLPVASTPILSFSKFPLVNRLRIGINARPNKWATGPIAVDAALPSRRDELASLNDVSWTGMRFVDVPCTKSMNTGAALPARCRGYLLKNRPSFTASKLVARMFMAGLAQ